MKFVDDDDDDLSNLRWEFQTGVSNAEPSHITASHNSSITTCDKQDDTLNMTAQQ